MAVEGETNFNTKRMRERRCKEEEKAKGGKLAHVHCVLTTFSFLISIVSTIASIAVAALG
jgi:hypothetical protein